MRGLGEDHLCACVPKCAKCTKEVQEKFVCGGEVEGLKGVMRGMWGSSQS